MIFEVINVPSNCHLKSSDSGVSNAWGVGVNDERGFIVLEDDNIFFCKRGGHF